MRKTVEANEGNGGEWFANVAIGAAVFALAALLGGCTTRTRSVDLNGMYLSEAGTLAIGSVEVQAAPQGEETAAIRYTEDTAWLSPTTKTHEIRILMTGTNSVSSAETICASICDAFVKTAPVVVGAAAGCGCATNAAAATAGGTAE